MTQRQRGLTAVTALLVLLLQVTWPAASMASAGDNQSGQQAQFQKAWNATVAAQRSDLGRGGPCMGQLLGNGAVDSPGCIPPCKQLKDLLSHSVRRTTVARKITGEVDVEGGLITEEGFNRLHAGIRAGASLDGVPFADYLKLRQDSLMSRQLTDPDLADPLTVGEDGTTAALPSQQQAGCWSPGR